MVLFPQFQRKAKDGCPRKRFSGSASTAYTLKETRDQGMNRMFAAALTVVLAFSVAACGQSAAVSESGSASAPESTAASSAASAAASTPTASPTAAPTATPAPTPEPMAAPTATAAPTPEPPQQAEPEATAPAAKGGHGYWTVYGDGDAFDAINALRASLGLGRLNGTVSLATLPPFAAGRSWMTSPTMA